MAWSWNGLMGRLWGQASGPSGHKRVAAASPWSTSQLQQVVMADVFGTEAVAVTRQEAVSVPAVAMARWLICVSLARHPLRVYDGDELAAAEREDRAPVPLPSPKWLTRTDGPVPPQFRMLWTLDDLLFTGYSLWRVERDDAGAIQRAERVPLEWWCFTKEWDVEVDGEPADPDSYLLFMSPMDALLDAGARTIRAARNIEEAWAARVRDPIPVMELRQVQDIELDEDPDDEDAPSEAQEIVDNYVAARKARTGAVVHTPYGYELHEHGTTAPSLYENGRNAVAIDIGRHTALPSGLLDASPVQASLTYTTDARSRSSYEDFSLQGWAMAIQARLSMDDVVPAGQVVLFDLAHTRTIPAPNVGPNMED